MREFDQKLLKLLWKVYLMYGRFPRDVWDEPLESEWKKLAGMRDLYGELLPDYLENDMKWIGKDTQEKFTEKFFDDLKKVGIMC